MGQPEVRAFLEHLAIQRHVAAATQNQALNALVFLYRHVLEQPLARLVSSRAPGAYAGCPYAKGAAGNIANEVVVYLLNGLGIDNGVDLDKLAATGDWITQAIGRPNRSRAGVALARR